MSSPTDRNEPPDGLDGWLNTPVEPLMPRPGTYEAIVRRARRRRLNRAVTAAGAAAMVIAAAAFVPQLGDLLTAQRVHAPPASSPRHGTQAARPRVTSNTTAAPQVTGGAGRLVQPGFTPVSVTFIGLSTGWALGQYHAPCPGGGCTALARTDDTGQHWTPLSGPDAGPPDGGSGVSQVRFLDQDNGWVFGPELWATHDGGQTWNKVSTGGQRVTGLETTGDRVFAVFARCSGTGRGWNTGCSWHQLRSAPASGGPWTAVPGASGPGTARVVLTRTTGYLLAQDGEAVTLSTGPVTGPRAWTAASPVACGQQSGQPPATPRTAPTPSGPAGPAAGGNAGGAPAAGSAPAGSAAAGSAAAGTPALLAAASASDLYLLCPPGTSAATGATGTGATGTGAAGSSAAETGGTGTGSAGPGATGTGATGTGATGTGGAGTAVYLTTDGGQHWQPRGSAPAATATSAAAAGSPPPGTASSPASGTGTAPGAGSGGTLLIGSASGVYVSADGGTTWQMSLQLPGGVGYVGMTDTRQGFAVPAGNGGNAIWFTEDGGQSWHPSAI